MNDNNMIVEDVLSDVLCESGWKPVSKELPVEVFEGKDASGKYSSASLLVMVFMPDGNVRLDYTVNGEWQLSGKPLAWRYS